MRSNNKNQKSSFIKSNYRITNILTSIFSYVICLAVILILKKEGDIQYVALPIIISFVVIVILSIISDFIVKFLIKKSEENRLKKIKEKLSEENPNMNMYPINPKLLEYGLSDQEYERLKSFRVSNVLSFIILGLILILIFVDFNNEYIFLNIILPMLMIVGGVGLLATLCDLLGEKLIKFKYRVIDEIQPPKLNKNKNYFFKNKRIFFVPIYIILAIITITVFVDFNNPKVISHIVVPCEIITIVAFILILVTDAIITKIECVRKMIDKEASDEIDYDLYNIDDMYKEERKDEDEI